jgi:5-methylcytosine-specific restriction protein A
MPALKVCSTGGCPVLVPRGTGRCPTCAGAADLARGTASERGYTGAGHRRFRSAVLQRDPTCVLCQAAPSTVADHYPISRRDLVDSGQDPDDPDRGRGLCKPCHDSATAVNQPGGWSMSR